MDYDIASISAELLSDFKNSKRLSPFYSFLRSSVGTYIGDNGLLRIAQPNMPRFDHDPSTGLCKGLLIESSRTNQLFPSVIPTMGAATVHNRYQSNGAVTVTSGISDPAGTNLGARISGAVSPTNSFDRSNFRIGGNDAESGTYAFSFWARSETGATVRLREPVIDKYHPAMVLTKEWKRFEFIVTGDGTNNLILYTTAGHTFDLYGLQLEAGNYATSYIPTTTAQATRATDSCYCDLQEIATYGTIVAVGPKSNGRYLYEFGQISGTSAERLIVETPSVGDTTSRRYQYVEGGQTTLSLGLFDNSGAIASTFWNKHLQVADARGNVITGVGNGVPANLKRLYIGMLSTNNLLRLDGHIEKIAFYRAMTNEQQLKALAEIHE